MPPPAKTARRCCQEQFGDPTVGRKPKKEYVNLFESKRLQGWWPIRDIGPEGEIIHAVSRNCLSSHWMLSYI